MQRRMLLLADRKVTFAASVEADALALRFAHQAHRPHLARERVPQRFAGGADPHCSLIHASDDHPSAVGRDVTTCRGVPERQRHTEWQERVERKEARLLELSWLRGGLGIGREIDPRG